MVKKVKAHIRGLKCEKCKTKLLSMYARSQTTFMSVANYYWCEKCNKVFLLNVDEAVIK